MSVQRRYNVGVLSVLPSVQQHTHRVTCRAALLSTSVAAVVAFCDHLGTLGGIALSGNQETRQIAIIGTGLIGQAWATVFLRAGLGVRLHDPDRSALAQARAGVLDRVQELVRNGLAAPQPSEGATGDRLILCSDIEDALQGVVYVQENAPEELSVKAELTARIDALTPVTVPIGSSTSGITASAYACEAKGRARCLVVHPVNPPHLLPAVEIVPAPWTDPDVTRRVCTLMQDVGQSPIVLNREIDGFVVNRLQGALLREAFSLLQDGIASAEGIDRAIADGLGPRWALMGPFETIHLNAPGGIAQYVARYGPMYREMFKGPAAPFAWDAALEAGLAETLSATHPLDSLPSAHKARDERLMALLRARVSRDDIL